ncbi:MAG TPA: MotA/TolQ/ExbB proton channel family protein [Cyclobacteriaceae bacterium]|nr:MotA/TolQ/ExbB proton channel family protein [Cyclobacteriaceae bacterium]
MRKIFLIVFGVVLTLVVIQLMSFLISNDLNVQGGRPFMYVLNLLLMVNTVLILYVITVFSLGKNVDPRLIETIKQIGGLAAAWGTWSTILGLFYAFDAIEGSKEIIPFPVIAGGLKVAVITVLYGLIIFCHALVAYIGLNLTRQAAG